MVSTTISLGEKIELRPRLSDGSYSSNIFASKVQDILSENEFLIFPLSEQNPSSWIGNFLQVMVIRENEAYVGVAVVEKTVKEENLTFLQLTFVESLARNQRRNFYRLKIGLEIEIDGYGIFTTSDISANGLAFITDKKFTKDETLAVNINLEDEMFKISGIVVRCNGVSEKKFLVAVYFKDIEVKLQDEIARFIHLKQFNMIKIGIL